MRIFALLVFYFAALMQSHAVIASVTGNWDNTATWGGAAIPTSTDSVNINGNIVVTIPAGYNATGSNILIGFSANTTGISTIVINGTLNGTKTLTVGGGAGKDGKLVFGPDAKLTNRVNIFLSNCYLESTATKANPARIYGDTDIQSPSAGARQSIQLSNVMFLNTNIVSFALQATNGTAGASLLTLRNCLFVHNSTISFGSTTTSNACPMSIRNCDFRDSANGIINFQRVSGGSALWEFCNNTIYASNSASATGGAGYQFKPLTESGLLFEGNVVVGGNINVPLTNTCGNMTVRGNYMGYTNPAISSVSWSEAGPGNKFDRNYFQSLGDNFAPFISNGGSNGSGTHIIRSNICDTANFDQVIFIDRPDFFLPAGISLDILYSYNLVIGAGEQVAGVKIPTLGTVNVKNNTIACTFPATGTPSTATGAIFVPETASPLIATAINLANNLTSNNDLTGDHTIYGSTTGTQIVTYSDYNYFYRLAVPYAPLQLTVSSGKTHEISNSIPAFVDASRNAGSWNVLFGSGVSNRMGTAIYWTGLNGYRGPPDYDQNGTVLTNAPLDMWRWVYDGFLTTDMRTKNGGDPADKADMGIGYTPSRTVMASMIFGF